MRPAGHLQNSGALERRHYPGVKDLCPVLLGLSIELVPPQSGETGRLPTRSGREAGGARDLYPSTRPARRRDSSPARPGRATDERICFVGHLYGAIVECLSLERLRLAARICERGQRPDSPLPPRPPIRATR